jgi:hypothetical protein
VEARISREDFYARAAPGDGTTDEAAENPEGIPCNVKTFLVM